MNKKLTFLCGAILLLILFIGCTQTCGDQQCQTEENNSTNENYCPNDCTA